SSLDTNDLIALDVDVLVGEPPAILDLKQPTGVNHHFGRLWGLCLRRRQMRTEGDHRQSCTESCPSCLSHFCPLHVVLLSFRAIPACVQVERVFASLVSCHVTEALHISVHPRPAICPQRQVNSDHLPVLASCGCRSATRVMPSKIRQPQAAGTSAERRPTHRTHVRCPPRRW